MFKSDFACIAKFLSRSYNKEEQMEMLKTDKQVLIHTKDTLYTLAAITKDEKYLQISETSKEESAVCEIADAFVKIGFEQGIERGIEQERSQGIKSMIEACKELGVNKDTTLSKVAEKYKLDDKQALLYMDKYWI